MINDNLLNADGNVLESSLVDTLNPSIIGGVTKEGNETFHNTVKYSNNVGDTGSSTGSTGGSGGGGSYVSPEMINSSISLTTSLLAGLKNRKSSDGCKKPIFGESGLNHGKWNRYRDCLRAEEKKRQDAIDLAQAQLQAQQQALVDAGGKLNDTITTDDKILGIPKTGFYIGLGVLVLVGGFITYKLVTRNKSGK